MTVVTDAYTQLANVLENVIVAEFVDDPYIQVKHDRLHESLGADGRTWVGISPEVETTPSIDNRLEVLIQFYGAFSAEVNPMQHVDPRIITNKAERLRRALRPYRTTGTSALWFFDVTVIRYPSDATGNKSRFEMSIQAFGENTGLVETTG